MRGFILLLCMLILVPCAAQGMLEKASDITEKCGVHPSLLRDRSGNIVWFSSEQLHSLAVTTVPPEKPVIPRQKYTGYVSINIMVSTRGDVICMWGGAGHPVMLTPAFKAVHEWRFKPLVFDGKAAEYVGTIKVRVESAD